MQDNKRHQGRIDCDIILNKFEDGHANICRAENVSMGGMRLKRIDSLEVGDAYVRLQFELPGEADPVWVGAEKVYETAEYFGVRFTDISHRHFVKLRDWLRRGEAA